MTQLAYRLNNVTFTYGQEFALKIANLDIPEATIFGVTGPNGSGKTTLLKILSFLLQPQTGSIKYTGKVVTTNILPQLRKAITLLFQDTLLLQRTVFENIAYGLKLRNASNIKTKVHDALTSVGLDPSKFAERKWHALSGGEAKRVALASRIILQPKVLLLDEPMTNIDNNSWQLIIKVLENMVAKQQTTVIISAHDVTSLKKIVNDFINLDNKLQPDINHMQER